MKIQKDKLIGFLDKIKLNNNITELIFDFKEDGLRINSLDVSQISMVNAILKKEVFTDYIAIGEVGVQNLQEIISLLKTFNKEINIKKEENLITFSESKYKIETEVVDSEFINKPPAAPTLEFNEITEINANDINSFLKNVGINKTYTILLTTENKKLIMNNTGKYKFTKEFDCDSLQGNAKNTYGQPLIDAMIAFNGKVTLNMSNDKEGGYPLKIYEKTDDSIISIIIAPMMENK